MTIRWMQATFCGITLVCVLLLTVKNKYEAKTCTTTCSTTITPLNSSLTWTTTQINTAPKRLLLTSSFMGRMGNHMFIYATLVGLARAQGREPFMSNGGLLESLFQVSHIRKDINTRGWTVFVDSSYGIFDAKLLKLPPQNMIISGYL